jgi:transposase-like protein
VATTAIAGKLGVASEALRLWLRRAETDPYQRPDVATAQRERIRALERANEILKAASACCARELDPRVPKPCVSSRRTGRAGVSSRSVGCCRSRPAVSTPR